MRVPIVDLKAQFKTIETEMTHALNEIVQQQAFVLGEAHDRFEEEVKRVLGTDHAVGLGSGTDAIAFALESLGVGPGDCVITTPFTFFATVEAIVLTGAEPVFVDIDRKSLNLDPGALEDYLRKKVRKFAVPQTLMDAETGLRVRAILPVHIYGVPADMDELCRIAHRYELPIVEDACQSFGARIATSTGSGETWRNTGTFGEVGCFSFYPSKTLGAYGDGGMAVTSRSDLADFIRSKGRHGETSKNLHESAGRTSRLDNLQAAVLLVKLRHLDEWNEKRRVLAARYNRLFERNGLSGAGVGPLASNPVVTPYTAPEHAPVYYLYSIRAHRRDELKAFLEKKGVGCAIHYPIPAYRQPCATKTDNRTFYCPVVEEACREILSLPLYPEMTQEQQDFVVDSIRAFYG